MREKCLDQKGYRFSFMFVIKTCVCAVGLWSNVAVSGSNIGLKPLHLRKFNPNIIGRDNFYNITAEPENVKRHILVNLTLTSTCPIVFIVEFELAPFSELKYDGFTWLKSPPSKFWKKNSTEIVIQEGLRAPLWPVST